MACELRKCVCVSFIGDFVASRPTDKEGESRNGRLCFGEDNRSCSIASGIPRASPVFQWDSGKEGYKIMIIG